MTTLPYVTFSCDLYRQNLFSGFTRLQEQQEFVDLTLAADGHIVKVHKNIMALASPYIKQILKMASSDSPIIFLNSVSHDVLTYLLEYIYQGEVNVPQERLQSFLQASQALHIVGMATQNSSNISQNWLQEGSVNQNVGANIEQQQGTNIVQQQGTHIVQQQDQTATSTFQGTFQNTLLQDTFHKNQSTGSVAACITINNKHRLKVKQIKNMQITNIVGHDSNCNSNETQNFSTEAIQNMPVVISNESAVESTFLENPANMEIDVTLPKRDDTNGAIEKKANHPNFPTLSDVTINSGETSFVDLNSLDKESLDALKTISQYTVTERGAVQIIVSRYIYSNHHDSRGGRKHRWRCIDYRRERCPAYIDSLDGRLILRKGLHNHGYHDEKIYKKHKKGLIFTSYNQAKEVWSKGQDLNTKGDGPVDFYVNE